MHLYTPREGRFFWVFFAVSGASCFAAGVLAPNHYLPWVSFHNEAPVFVALILFWFGALLQREKVALPRNGIFFVATLVVLIALQAALGQIHFTGDALVSILFILGAAASWWLGAQQAVAATDPQKNLVVAATVVVFVAVMSSLIAVFQWLNLEQQLGLFAVEREAFSRVSSNLAQPNLLATLVIMGTVFSFFLWSKGRLTQWQVLLLVCFLSFILVATESRQGLLSTLCVGCFLLWRAQSKAGAERKFVAVWWGCVLFFGWLWAPLNEALLLQAPRHMVASVDSVRITLWQQSLAAISQSPWVGYGWRQTAVAQKFGALAAPGTVTTDYAHNIFLDLLSWVGIPLGVMLLVMMGWWLTSTVRRMQGQLQKVLFAVTIPFFVHSMLEFPFAYAFFLFPVAAVFGLIHALQRPSSFETDGAGSMRLILGRAAFLGFGVVCGIISIDYLKAEEDMRVMRFELRRVGATPVGYAVPEIRLLTQLDEMLRLGRLEVGRGMSAAELNRLGDANLALSWATLHLKYVVALALNGKLAEAEHQLRILNALYGPKTYEQGLSELRRLSETKFPELMALQSR